MGYDFPLARPLAWSGFFFLPRLCSTAPTTLCVECGAAIELEYKKPGTQENSAKPLELNAVSGHSQAVEEGEYDSDAEDAENHNFLYSLSIRHSSTCSFHYYNLSDIKSVFEAIYRPLNSNGKEIRLLRLLPGIGDDRVACELYPVSLDEHAPAYEALSYTWGKASETEMMLLDGWPFQATGSLESALTRLRYEDKARLLWVDALCINQADLKERSEQVALMGEIYSRTQQCLIWLGKLDDVAWSTSGPLLNSSSSNRSGPSALERAATTPIIFHNDDRDHGLLQHHFPAQPSFELATESWTTFRSILQSPDAGNDILRAFLFLRHMAEGRHIAQFPLLEVDDAGRLRASPDWAPCVHALLDILLRPWWRRMWIVQETVLPPKATIHLGNISAPFSMFEAAVENWLAHSRGCCSNIVSELPENARIKFQVSWKWLLRVSDFKRRSAEQKMDGKLTYSFSELANIFQNRQATDPRDKIYGLLSLLPEEWKSTDSLRPDYTLPVSQVYTRAASRMIEVDGTLDVLALKKDFLIPRDDPIRNLPTWVPDWDHVEVSNDEPSPRILGYNASGGRHHLLHIYEDTILLVSNIKIGVISSVGETFLGEIKRDITTPEILSQWHELAKTTCCAERPGIYLPSSFSSTKEPTTDTTVLEAFLRTILGDRRRFLSRMSSHRVGYGKATPQDLEDTERYLKFIWSNLPTPSQIPIDIAEENVSRACNKKRFFVTENGYIGLGPQDTQVGDEAHVLLGSRVPFVLRPTKRLDDGSCLNLVGRCYVHGVMEGELLRNWDPRTPASSIVYIV